MQKRNNKKNRNNTKDRKSEKWSMPGGSLEIFVPSTASDFCFLRCPFAPSSAKKFKPAVVVVVWADQSDLILPNTNDGKCPAL